MIKLLKLLCFIGFFYFQYSNGVETSDFLKISLNPTIDPCENFYKFACGNMKKNMEPDELSHWHSVRTSLQEKIKFLLNDDETNDDVIMEKLLMFRRKCLTSPGEDSTDYFMRFLRGLFGPEMNPESTENWERPFMIKVGTFFDMEFQFLRNFGHSLFFHAELGEALNSDSKILNLAYKSPKRLEISTLLDALRNLSEKTDLHLLKTNISSKQQVLDMETLFEKLLLIDNNPSVSGSILKPVEYFNADYPFLHGALTRAGLEKQSTIFITKADAEKLSNISEIYDRANSRYRLAFQNLFRAHSWQTLFSTNSQKKSNKTLEKICMNQIFKSRSSGFFAYALLARLVTKFGPTQNNIENLRVLTDNLRDQFIKSIMITEWIDSEAKLILISSIKAISIEICYPAWVLDKDAVSKYYHFLKDLTESDSYLSLLSKLYQNKWDTSIKKVNSHLKDAYPRETLRSAYFASHPWSQDGAIFLPLGLFQHPFYHDSIDDALLYGIFGSIIGHEIFHILEGSLRSIKNRQMWNEYVTRAEYFVEFFSNFCFEIKEKPTCIDGDRTLPENLADYYGLSAALNAFKLVAKPTHLFQYGGMNPYQLFFLSYANIWCRSDYQDEELLRFELQYGVHSPVEARVEANVKRLYDFSKNYQCYEKSSTSSVKGCSTDYTSVFQFDTFDSFSCNALDWRGLSFKKL